MKKRDQILQTTLELITELGFHATPMALIIEKSGVSAGAIYYYFKSKEELIDTLYSDLKKEMGFALVNGIENESNYKLKFFLLWKNLFNFYFQNPKKFEFIQQYSNSPFIRKEIKELNQVYFSKAINFLEEGKAIGIIRDLPNILLLNLIFGNVAVLATMIITEEIVLTNEILENTIHATWNAVKTS